MPHPHPTMIPHSRDRSASLNQLSASWKRSWRCLLASLSWCVCTTPAHAQRDLTDIPQPDPVAELAAMQVAEGFEVNLFAADPDIASPIHMNWDAEGRLWIAASKHYPQLQPGAEPTDELIVLEDTNGDGVADKRTVFADDLMIPTGVLPGDGGVYVANSTQLIHLSDTDGDGKADQRRTILSGFGTEDTHHLLHTPRWRPDGRMSMNQSIYIHSHLETPYGIKHLDGGGIWNFDPHTSELEIFCKGFVNPWGHAIDPYGQSFATDGAYFDGINYTFPGAVFVTSPGATRWLSGLNPGSPKHCGLEILSGSAMPEDYQGVLVTNDFRGHRVCMFKIEKQGAGYRSVQLPELIRSEHIAFRPIDVKMGPDGAIYVADWYNPIIQHGEVDFRDPRRDTEHGRIWRITAKGHTATKRPAYATLTESQLAERLTSSALWERQFARQELAQREPGKVDSVLAKLSEAPAADPSRQLQRMWLSLAQHRFEPSLVGELRQAEDPRVRAAALRVIGEQQSSIPEAEAWLLSAIDDTDDQVVLEAVCGLHRSASLAAVQGILQAAQRPEQDQYLKFAIWNGLRDTESQWLPAFESGELSVTDLRSLQALTDAATSPSVAKVLVQQIADQPAEFRERWVELIAAKGDAQGLGALAHWICNAAPRGTEEGSRLLRIVGAQAKARNMVPSGVAAWLPASSADLPVEQDSNRQFRIALSEVLGQWKVVQTAQTLSNWLQTAVASEDVAMARATAGALAALPAPEGRLQVEALAEDRSANIELRGVAIAALGSYDTAAACKSLLALLQDPASNGTPAGADEALTAILNSKSGAAALKKAIAGTQKADWSPDRARDLLAAVRLNSQSSPELEQSIIRSTGLENAGWKISPEFTQEMLGLMQREGDPANGEQIYRRGKLQCVNCHAIGQSGIAIGPNLVSLGASSSADYVLESLIDPSAKVKEGFQTLSVLLDDDEIVSGLQKTKTPQALTLQLADGSLRTLPTDTILESRDGKSLMPAGLVDQLSEAELADLLAFLSSLGKQAEYTVDTKNWVRNYETLLWTPEANSRLNRTSWDTAATDDPSLTWGMLSTTVQGRLPLHEAAVFQPHREVPRTVFLKFTIDCKKPGAVNLRFSESPSAISYWIDTRPEPTPQAGTPIMLTTGLHEIVLGVRVEETSGWLGCEVVEAASEGALFDLPPPAQAVPQ
ncbi:PVC-type heme-binding CxxCH protein [Aureliella helgolandensis]|uniref:Cytochrome c n=1 Tax=Aureliella helgolandensis TaxID=2527968 RepID=A0A518G2A9_9BACT|nr:PVC-type heme-binding CxxCH protein [Aureliella helgolandensis]QDV22746.1 Cytochrome c [Aureliella helgolandensis]